MYYCINHLVQQYNNTVQIRKGGIRLNWKFDDKRPIYTQLVEKMKILIITGAYEPGGRLASVRELAGEAGVNPNTMQRALSELENSGLVYSQRTAGRFITEDTELIKEMRRDLAVGKVREFVEEMCSLGLGKEEIIRLVEEFFNE